MSRENVRDWGAMSPAQEQAFERRAEKHFRGQRELRNGRNFRFWNRTETEEDRRRFRSNYDAVRWDRA